MKSIFRQDDGEERSVKVKRDSKARIESCQDVVEGGKIRELPAILVPAESIEADGLGSQRLVGCDEVPEDEKADVVRKLLLDVSLMCNAAATRFRPLSLVQQEELVD